MRRRRATLFTDDRQSYSEVPRPAFAYGDFGIENSSESVARRPARRQVVFSHFSKWRRVWEYVMFMVSVTPVWEIPFFTIFYPQFGFYHYIPFILCDILYIIDYYILTHTAFLSHGVMIYDQERIMRHHFSRISLWVHRISLLPISWTAIWMTSWWQYLLIALPRLLRVRRAMAASESFSRLLVYYSWKSVLFPVLSAWVLLVHVFACFFYLCAKFEGFEQSWIAYLGWDYLRPEQDYIVSVYFVMTTIFAIGCGDLTPQTSAETILVIFIQLIGVCSNAYLIGSFVSLLIDDLPMKFIHGYGSFVEFLRFKGVDTDLRKALYLYFEYKWKTNHGADDPSQVYKFIPETVRNHLKRDMCEAMLMEIGMFNMASEDLRLTMAKIMKSVEYIPGDVIIEQGKMYPCVIVLSSGTVRRYQDGADPLVYECHGTAYGELELMIDMPRQTTVVAVTHVTGWKLDREDFQVAIGSQHNLKRELLGIVSQLFPDYHQEVKQLLSKNVVDVLMTMNDSSASEYGSSDVGVALQDTSDSSMG